MKNANWIYESVFPENEEMFKKIEAALGFKLFFWQKAYIITGQFRRYGKTTAEIEHNEKNKISHRYKALEKLRDYLNKVI